MSNEEARIIFTRWASGTYIARLEGKIASCTAGPQMAAEAVARKVMGDEPFTLKRLGTEYAWELIEGGK